MKTLAASFVGVLLAFAPASVWSESVPAWIEWLGWTLVHSVWQLAAVAIIAALVDRALRRRAANVRYVVGVTALGLMLALPCVTWMLVAVEPRSGQVELASVPDVAPLRDVAPIALPTDDDESSPHPARRGGSRDSALLQPNAASSSAESSEPLGQAQWGEGQHQSSPRILAWLRVTIEPRLPWLVALWIAGVVLCSLRPTWGLWTQWRLRRVGLSPVSETVQRMLLDLAKRMQLARVVRVAASTFVRVPMVVGYLRPMILLPACVLTGLTPTQLEAVLAHELAHVRRHDWLVNALQVLAETLLFYHPAVWWLSNRIRHERELCCDDFALSLINDKAVFARTLLILEELRQSAVTPALAATGGNLAHRVRRLLPTGQVSRRPNHGTGAMVLVTLCLSLSLFCGAFVASRRTVATEPPPRAGRGSPDPALDPTAGLPNSDEETNPTNNANGDLRSNPAAGSGDTSRAQDGEDANDDPIAATVNGIEIREANVLEPFGEQLAKLRKNGTHDEYQKARRELIEQHLKRHIERQLVVQESNRTIWPGGREQIDEYAEKGFEEHLAELKKDLGVSNLKELKQQLQSRGSSLAIAKSNYFNEIHSSQFIARTYPNGGKEKGADLIDDLWKQAEIKTAYNVAKGHGISDELRDWPNQRIRDELLKTTEAAFVDTPLEDVLTFFSDYHNIKIKPDAALQREWPKLSEKPITIEYVDDLTVLLGLVLEPLRLTYRIEGGELLVTTPGELQRRGEKQPESITATLEKLAKNYPDVKWLAIAHGNPSESDAEKSLPGLIRALSDDTAATRLWSLKLLGQLGDIAPSAIPALIKVTQDRDDKNRRTAYVNLVRMSPKHPEALKPVADGLRRSDAAASFALPHWPIMDEAFDQLIDVFDDPNATMMRATIAGYLFLFKDDAIPVLKKALSDPDRVVRLRASFSLKKLGVAHDDPRNEPPKSNPSDDATPETTQKDATSTGPAPQESKKPRSNRTTDLDPDEWKAAESSFGSIKDREPLKTIEMPLYWRMLGWAVAQPFAELQRRAGRDVSFKDLLEDPDKSRGRPARLRLHVRRVLEYDAPQNPLGVKKVHEAWGFTDDSGSAPFVIVFTDLPAGMKVGVDIKAEADFAGYLLKLMSYSAGDGTKRTAPLLLGRLDPTAGLPNSDEATNPTNNANGDLRSKPAAGSGEPRRAQQEPSKPKAGEKLDAGAERRLKWGEPVNGLRAAMCIQSVTDAAGDQKPDLFMAIQNVSEAPIHLVASAEFPNPRNGLLSGRGLPQSRQMIDETMPMDVLLQPRQVTFMLWIERAAPGSNRADGTAFAIVLIWNTAETLTGTMAIDKAPPGAWTGKLITGDTSGADAMVSLQPKGKEAQSLFKKWKNGSRANGDIPGGALGPLVRVMTNFVKNNPTHAAAPKFAELVKRIDTARDWPQAAAVTLLDEVSAIYPSLPEWVEGENRFRLGGDVVAGKQLPEELKNAPWGEAQPNGLRVAWLLEADSKRGQTLSVPGEAKGSDPVLNPPWRALKYRLNTPLKSRLLFHNSGKNAVVFRALTWNQSGGHKARDAQGAEINIMSVEWTTIPMVFACRLAPGEFLEVIAAGIGVGANKDDEDWRDARSQVRVGAWIEAKAGDEVTFLPDVVHCDARDAGQPEGEEVATPKNWWLKFIANRLSLDAPLPADAAERKRLLDRATHDLFGNAPTPEEITAFTADAAPDALDALAKRLASRPGFETFSGSLKSGTRKFLVLPVDPEAAKKPRTAKNPGQYPLGGNATFVVTRRPIGERIVNEAHLAFSPTDATKPAPREPHKVPLPDGYDTWAAAWMRGGTELWILQKGSIRRYDVANPAQVKETSFAETEIDKVPKPILEALRNEVPFNPNANGVGATDNDAADSKPAHADGVGVKRGPPDGLEFLKPYPKLHGLSLDMTEPQFLEIVQQQELKTRKTVEGEKVTHHIALGDDHTLIVMFDKDAKCSGIQRIRGDDTAGELEPFQGTWAMDLCDSEIKGFGDSQGVVRNWRWAINGNEVVWSRSKDEVWKLTFAVDPTKSPKEIDLTFLDGPHKGEKCLGMYEWGGINKKMLLMSVQDPGAKVERPKSISMKGGGQTSLIFLQPMDAEKELASLQGTWKFEIIQTDGWPKPKGKGPDRLGRGDDRQWVIKGNEITWTSPDGEEVKLSFAIDPTKSPKHFDVTFLSGPHKGQKCPGMYERGGLGGVVLWLCLTDPGSQAPRPTKVSYSTNEGRTMIGLYRVEQPEKPAEKPADSGVQVIPPLLEFRFAAQPPDSKLEPRVPADFEQRTYPHNTAIGRMIVEDKGFVWVGVFESEEVIPALPVERPLKSQVREALLADTPEHTLPFNGKWSVEECRVVPDSNGGGRFGIELKLNEAGGAALRTLTKSHLNQPLAILVNNKIIAAPIVRSEIGRDIAITGNFTREQADRLAKALSLRPQAAPGF